MPIPVCLHQYLWTYTGYKFLWGDFSWLSKVFCYKMIPFPQWHCYRFSNWLWINDAVFLFLDIRTQEDLETENPEIFQTLKRETFVLMILMITKAMNNLLLKFLIFKESVPKLIPNIFLILWGKLSCEKDIYLLLALWWWWWWWCHNDYSVSEPHVFSRLENVPKRLKN